MTDKLHILTFSTLFPNPAQPTHGIFVENRLRHLLASGEVDATVVAPVPWFPSSARLFGRYAAHAQVPDQETRHGITIYHPRYPVLPKIGMNLAPQLLYRAVWPTLKRLVRSGRPIDLIDAHYFYPDGVAAARAAARLGLPFTITARGSDINQIADFALPRRQILAAAAGADGLIAVCQALKDRMVELGVPAARITVLRNGVDLEQFRPAAPDSLCGGPLPAQVGLAGPLPHPTTQREGGGGVGGVGGGDGSAVPEVLSASPDEVPPAAAASGTIPPSPPTTAPSMGGRVGERAGQGPLGPETARKQKTPRLLSVGLLIPRKGHDLVIRALADLPAAELWVAGQGPEEGALRRLARALGLADRVRFLGTVAHDRLAEIYGAADALVLASSREGWANVLLEAMACGTPVVASNVWGAAEIVTSPAAGRLMKSRDVAGIVAAVTDLMADYPDRAEVRRFAEQFSWDDTTAGQLTLFRRILAERRVFRAGRSDPKRALPG